MHELSWLSIRRQHQKYINDHQILIIKRDTGTAGRAQQYNPTHLEQKMKCHQGAQDKSLKHVSPGSSKNSERN